MSDIAFSGDGFTISRLVAGDLDNNVYLVTDMETNRSVIVDAADDADAIIAFAGDTDVIGIPTTHGHWDHHNAIPAVSDALDAPFMLHPFDADIAGKPVDLAIHAGFFRIGSTEATVAHTPGHTPGSVCVALPGVVMTGDTLFPGGPGATRFDHSSFAEIISSLETKIFVMPDETVVLPGHGAPTTIGTERPQLPGWIERGW